MTSGSGTFSTYRKWNARGQRNAVDTLEADHGAWMSARVEGTDRQPSTCLASRSRGPRRLASLAAPLAARLASLGGRLEKLARTIASPYDRRVHTCDVCSAKVHELRRGRCWGCYARWVDARPVGVGARC